MTNQELEVLFSQAVNDAVAECHRLKYYPARFERMLRSTTAVHLAKKLVVSSEIQYGLKQLKKLGRLDISLESLITTPKFAPLFTPAERAAATFRLIAATRGYV